MTRKIFAPVSQKQGLFTSPAWSVTCGSSGIVWWTTEFDGIYGWDNGKIIHDSPSLLPDLPHPIDVPIKETSICGDNENTLWIGTSGGGLLKKVNGRYEAFKDTAQKHPFVNALFQDRNGCLWVGTRNGLGYIQNDKWQDLMLTNGLMSDAVNALAEDSRKNIWIGTRQGLIRYCNGISSPFKSEIFSNQPVTALSCDDKTTYGLALKMMAYTLSGTLDLSIFQLLNLGPITIFFG